MISFAKALVMAGAFFASSIALVESPSRADSLYYSGPGRYGGNSYQDSSGEYWDQDTRYGSGKYGGGDYTDRHGNEIYCDRSGYCTNY